MPRPLVAILSSAVLALLSVTLLSYHPAGAESRIQVQSVSVESWPAMQVTLTALDEQGQPQTGLTAGEFAVSINGQTVPVSRLQTTSDPGLGVALVLAFDVSGSMAGAPIAEARAAGKALVGQLGPDDQAAIVAFGSTVGVRQAFTSDKQLLAAAIDGLTVAGDTALYSGVQTSAQLLLDSGLPRRALVLLSDGSDFGGVSTIDRSSSIEAVRQSGALTFAVGLGSDIDQGYLNELAQAGQGQFLLAPQPSDLTNTYLTAGGALRQQYVVTVDTSGIRAEAAEASLIVEAVVAGVSVFATAPLTLPAAALTPAEPPVQPPAVTPGTEPQTGPQAAPSSANDSQGAGWIAIPILAAVLLAGGLGLVLFRRSRRRLATAAASAEGDADPLERIDREPPPLDFPEIVRASTNGHSAWIDVPDAGRVALGEAPLTVGVTPDCDVRLSAKSVHQARFRIWRRENSYMVHNLSQPLSNVTIAGRPVSWAVLEDGDEIVVAGSKLSFHEAAQAST